MKIKKWNGSSWVQEYPEVNVSSIVATGTPNSSSFLRGDGTWATPSTQPHTHGNINNNGTLTAAPVAIQSGDRLLITNFNNSDLIEKSLGFGTGITTFLRNDGTWQKPYGAWASLYSAGPTLVTASTASWTAFALGYTPSSGDIFALRLSAGSNSASIEKAIVFVEFGTFSSTAGMSAIGFFAYGGVSGTNLVGRNIAAQWQISGSNLQLRYPTLSDWNSTLLFAMTTFYVWNIWKVN